MTKMPVLPPLRVLQSYRRRTRANNAPSQSSAPRACPRGAALSHFRDIATSSAATTHIFIVIFP